MTGGRKYEDLATQARVLAKAEGVLLIVFDGARGPGFSAQLPGHLLTCVPAILRDVAGQIERDISTQSIVAATQGAPKQ